MEPGKPPVLIDIKMGNDEHNKIQPLVELEFINYQSQQQVKKIKKQAKYDQQLNGGLAIVFHYSVQAGRQSQAQEYIRLAAQEQIPEQEMTPLQQLLINRPKTQGSFTITSQPGKVIVTYRFSEEKINQDVSFKTQVLGSISRFQSLNFKLELKGFVSHSLKNRANVKVDYAHLHVEGQKIDSETLMSILTQNQAFSYEDLEQQPFLGMIGKAKKVNLKIQLKPFREMNRFFNKLVDEKSSKKKKEKQDFKYMNKGIFKEDINAFVIYSNNFACAARLRHYGEDIIMRLIKVYSKSLKYMDNNM